MPTQHDIGKQIMNVIPPLDHNGLVEAKQIIKKYFDNKQFDYLMFLCNELRYFTFFKIEDNINSNTIGEQIIDFILTDDYLSSFGGIKNIEPTKDYLEIWLGDYHFGLFQSDSFVVKLTKDGWKA